MQRFDWDRPEYPIQSVDNALKLIQLLRDEGQLTLTEAATQLSVAPSTAHRLLAMLVYRGYAVRAKNRTYLAGPTMNAAPVRSEGVRNLREVAQPFLEALTDELCHTSNLFIRVGANVRTILTIEAVSMPRIGDRRGTVIPAHRASGGKVLLAQLPTETLRQILRGPTTFNVPQYLSEQAFTAFLKEMDVVRRQGYGVNDQDTEVGVISISMPIFNAEGKPIAAFGLSIPHTLFATVMSDAGIARMVRTQREIESAVVRQG